jgi:hypothetical protein
MTGWPFRPDAPLATLVPKALPRTRFLHLIVDFEEEGWIGENHFWDAEDPRHVSWFGYHSVKMRSQRIVISDFRVKTLVTWLLVPSDGDYRRFNERVWSALEDVTRNFGFQPLQMIDPMTAVKDGYVSLRRVLLLSEVTLHFRATGQSELIDESNPHGSTYLGRRGRSKGRFEFSAFPPSDTTHRPPAPGSGRKAVPNVGTGVLASGSR